jgi:hypothetical protein
MPDTPDSRNHRARPSATRREAEAELQALRAHRRSRRAARAGPFLIGVVGVIFLIALSFTAAIALYASLQDFK